MPYNKTNWQNTPSTNTPISAANLNKLETQYDAVASDIGNTTSPIGLGLSQRFVQGMGMIGPGIDPTGVSDSTAAVQALVDSAGTFGADVNVPAGAVITLSDTLRISAKINLYGPGTLQWLTGISGKPAIRITANGCAVKGLTVRNPNELGTPTGDKNFGIVVAANEVILDGNLIDTFQSGIAVSSSGEWANIIITNNRVKDVLGSGTGPTGTDNYGEDRGDGIVVWGCQATITGNIVNCKAGRDARVGIHAEGLEEYEGNANPPHPDSMVTMSGNVVFGKFRRGIVAEDVSHVAITGNSIADATWWAICIIGPVNELRWADACTVTGNTIRWTRTATDLQGSAWGPIRAPIAVYGGVYSPTVTGNSVVMTSDSVANTFLLIQSASATRYIDRASVMGNVFEAMSGAGLTYFVRIESNSSSTRIHSNQFYGSPSGHGIYSFGARRLSLKDNLIECLALSGTRNGVRIDGSTSPSQISGNVIVNFTTAIYAVNTPFVQVVNNFIDTATTGMDLFGCTYGVVTGNGLRGVTGTKIANSGGTGMVVASNPAN